MLSPSRIATIAAAALAISMTMMSALTIHESSMANLFLYVLFPALVGALLVGFGTFLGTRWAPPLQRTRRLASSLGALYLALGVVLTFRIPTHAVKLDMPPPGTHVAANDVDLVVSGILRTLAAVVLPVIIARGAAAICAKKFGPTPNNARSGRDA